MIDAALLLPKILARAGDNQHLVETSAKIAWARAVGEGLRQHAQPGRLDGKTLNVFVADAVWQKQLAAMSAELIFRVNKLLRGEVVDSIEFRINPAGLGRRGPTASKRSGSASAHPLPANVISSAAGITDLELRQRFMRAAQNCITRREAAGR